jgi:hypothetical protein
MTFISRKYKTNLKKSETPIPVRDMMRMNYRIAAPIVPSASVLPESTHMPVQKYDQYNGIIVSLATTMSRIESFFTVIESIEAIDRVFKVVIQLCKEYKRFKTVVPDQDLYAVMSHPILMRLNAKNGYQKYVVHVTEDWGPITKLMGVYAYCTQNQYTESKIVIIDDDTEYLDNCLSDLVRYKTPKNIVSGSGFLFFERMEYTIIDETGNRKGHLNRADIVEGFSGICFQYDDINAKFMRFIKYYCTIDWIKSPEQSESETYNCRVNTFLKACFLGDDFVISYYFGKSKALYKVFGYIDSLKQQDYGYGADALHQNVVFQSNNGSYLYILQNIDIFEALLLRIDVCAQIRQLGTFQLRPLPRKTRLLCYR